jgi:superfamily II DNA or RNA helicase
MVLLCRYHNVPHELEDRRRSFPDIDLEFKGNLKPFQEKAVRMMLAKDFGTLTAPTASGKTVMALYMISQHRHPAIIVVHTKELAFQWTDRIETFLGIPANEVGFLGDHSHDN